MDGPPTGGRFDGPWTELGGDDHWSLWGQPASDLWVGRPWRQGSSSEGQVWLFGGTTGLDTEDLKRVAWQGGNPADLGTSFHLLSRHVRHGWQLVTDRMGTIHAYRGTRCAGSSFESIRQRSARQLDRFGIAGFFSHGFFPGDRTYFEDVRIFGPAARFSLDQVGFTPAKRYWHWSHQPAGGRSYGQTLDQFIDLFRGLMAEMDHGDLAIPISGGLDSRLTVAALAGKRAGRRAYSYGYEADSVEIRIASRIASRRALPFQSWVIRPYLFDQMPAVLAAVEGFQDVTQSRQVFVAPWLRRHGASVVAAHWGDVWLDDMAWHRRADNSSNLTDYLLGRIQKRGRGPLLDHFLGSAKESRRMAEELRTWVSDGLGAYGEVEDPDFRIKAFKTDNWSFRWTLASLRAYELGATPRLPFYDPRLVDFFTTVPTGFVARRRLQIDAIKHLAPDLARVTWQAYDASLYTWHLTGSLHLPKRAIKKLWRTLRRRRPLLRNWEVQLLPQDQFQRLQANLLDPGLAVHEWFPRTALESLLNGFRARPDAAAGFTISMLLTFARALEPR